MESNNFNPSILIVSLDCQIAMNFFESYNQKLLKLYIFFFRNFNEI